MDIWHDALKARLLELEKRFREFGVGTILDRIQDASRKAPTKVAQDKTFHIDGSQITFPYTLHIGDAEANLWACSGGRVICEANTPGSSSSFLVACWHKSHSAVVFSMAGAALRVDI
jgi:hypothetical protein